MKPRCVSLTALAVALILVSVSDSVRGAEQGRPLVIAHRGLLKHAPENTLSNFRACLELRIGFEFDVQRTKDGTLVCIHDTTVDRTTNGKGAVADLTLSQIRGLDAGSWFDRRFAGERVPTINEVLKLVAEYATNDVLIAVDLKADGIAKDVVQIAESHKVLHRLIFIGTTISDPKVREDLKAKSPAAQTAIVANKPDEFAATLESAANWSYVRYLPPPEQIEAAHRAHRKVFIAGPTVAGQLTENWKQAAALGIDAILTDFPLELREALNSQ